MPHTPSSFALGQSLEAEKMVEKVRQRASAWQDKVAQTGRRCSRAGSQAARQPGSQAARLAAAEAAAACSVHQLCLQTTCSELMSGIAGLCFAGVRAG